MRSKSQPGARGASAPEPRFASPTPDGIAVAPDEEGELQVRGCLLFPGYFDNEAANRNAFAAGGWFRSGDLATIDAHGNVAITGRIKDVINRGGVKFNPRDIEDLLDAHPKPLRNRASRRWQSGRTRNRLPAGSLRLRS